MGGPLTRRNPGNLGTAWGIACAVFCLFVSSSAAAEPSPIPEGLLPLARELELQFHLSFDSTPPAYRARIQHTLRVFAAWQRSARTPRDEALLEDWLHDALDRSLPGRNGGLAEIPAFSDPSSVGSSDSMADRVTADGPSARPQVIDAPPRRPAEPPVVAMPPAVTRPPAHGRRSYRVPGRPPHVAARPPSIRDDLRPSDVVRTPAPPAARGPSRPAMTAPRPVDVVAVETAEEHSRAEANLNLDEYAARLVGHRLGIRQLEARLLDLETPTADQLATLVGELEALHNQGSLLALYARLLPADWKTAYGGPISAAEAVILLADLVHSRQAHLAQQAAPAGSHDRESALLSTLAAKLAQLAAVVQHAALD